MIFQVRALRASSIAAARALLSCRSGQTFLLTDLSVGSSQPHQILADFKSQGFDFYPKEAFDAARSSASKAMVFGLLHTQSMRRVIDDMCRGNPILRALEASAKLILSSISRGLISEVLFVPPLEGIRLDTENEWLLWFVFSRATPAERQCLSFVVGASGRWRFPDFLCPETSEPGAGHADLDDLPSYTQTSENMDLLARPGLFASAPIVSNLLIPVIDSTLYWVAPCLREMSAGITFANPFAKQISDAGTAFLGIHPDATPDKRELFDIAIRKNARDWASCGGFDCAHRLLSWAVSLSNEQRLKSRFTLMILGVLVASERFEALEAYESEVRLALPQVRGEMLFLLGWGKLISGDVISALSRFNEAELLLKPSNTRLGLPYLRVMLAQAYAQIGLHQKAYGLQKAIEFGNDFADGRPKDSTLHYLNQTSLAKLSLAFSDSQSAIHHFKSAFLESRNYLSVEEAMYREGCIARALSSSQSSGEGKMHWLNAALHFVANPVPESINRRHLQIFLPSYRGSKLRAVNWISAWLIDKLQIESYCHGDESQAAVFLCDGLDQVPTTMGNAEAWITPERALVVSGRFLPSSLHVFKEHTRLRIGLTNFLAAELKAPFLPRSIVVPTRSQPLSESFEDTCDRMLASYSLSAIRTKFSSIAVSPDEISEVRRRCKWELSSQVTLTRDLSNELVLENRRFGERTRKARPILNLLRLAEKYAGTDELSPFDYDLLMALERENVVSMTLRKEKLQDLTVESAPVKGDHSLTP
jgi:tetratricopeptide (TPR) repeat protein